MKLTFKLPAPKASDLTDSLSLWSTYYYAHDAKEVASGGVPLTTLNDVPLGPRLSQRDWCLAAMEGTVVVRMKAGGFETFNFSGKGNSAQTSCKLVFPNISAGVLAGTERVRWQRAKGPFGDGPGGFLTPYRSLAVDKSVIKLGTVLFIAKARGVAIPLPDGSTVKHDGYFYAADVGGMIKGNHVDTFLGVNRKNPFAYITSAPAGTFDAQVCVNAAVITFLKTEHQ